MGDATLPSSRVRVSVVTPFLNAERYLKEAVASVFAQTYPHWELLLVDDGSIDRSTAIAREIAAAHPDRVRYLEHASHANRGSSASRNLGVRHARGEIVAFLDADDVYLPEKFERQLAWLDAHPDAEALYGNTIYWYGWTGRNEDSARDHRVVLGVAHGAVAPPPSLLPPMLRGRIAVPCPTSVLVRAATFRRVGGFEDSFTGMYDDQAFYAKLMLAAPILVVDEALERYRQHDDSCCACAERSGTERSARLVFLLWLDRYLTQVPDAGREVHAALRFGLSRCRHPHVHVLAAGARRAAGRLRAAIRYTYAVNSSP